MEPDKSAEVLARGAAIGDSRVVCGVHFVSDVEAGRRVGAAVFAAEQNAPDFQADLRAAKAEIDARRAELENWQLESVLKRVAQAVGQWVGVNYENLPQGTAAQFSSISQLRSGLRSDRH